MFKNPFSFNGRIRRLEYGLTIIIYLVYVILLSAILSSYRGGNINSLLLVLIIPAVWFHMAQGVKRCHDLGNSGWYQVIPFYGLFMLFQDGYRGETNYGHDPKVKEASSLEQ